MKTKSCFLLFSILFISFTNLFSQNFFKKDTNRQESIYLNFPLIDLPYCGYAAKTVTDDLNGANANPGFGDFFKGYANPSMEQSLNISTDAVTMIHFGVKKLINPKNKILRFTLRTISVSVFDYFSLFVPLGSGWTHEEFHRAVMTKNYINSLNELNQFQFGAEVVSVSHEKDETLARMKSTSNKDFIRMSCAGNEAQMLQLNMMHFNNFFYNSGLPNVFYYWFVTITANNYVKICSDATYSDDLTVRLHQNEGSDISKRDFTGLDYTAWTYDLFRPNDPYSYRGIHPSGVGIDRYIKTSDLTADELAYLQKIGKNQSLNFISPMMFGIRSIKLFTDKNGNTWRGNFYVHHYLTSFGNDISTTILIRSKNIDFLAGVHIYKNYQKTYPGLEFQLVNKKITIANKPLYITPRVIVGLQPKDQIFKTNNSQFLGMAEIRAEYQIYKSIYAYCKIYAKTDGWIAGNEFLESNAGLTLGISLRF